MSVIDDLKKMPGARVLTFGELNKFASPKPLSAKPTVAMPVGNPLEGISVTAEYLLVEEHIIAGSPVVFVSGKAGTGKSTLITYLRNKLTKNFAVVAPTGVAALNVQGVTLHSFFQLPPRLVSEQDIKKAKNRSLYSRLDLLIVDEISMVRVDLMDAMDKFLRLNGKDKTRPFGGTQLLFVGDMFQLPPVVTKQDRTLLTERGYTTEYFFSAKSLEQLPMAYVELTEIFRQRDPEFTSMLNSIRIGEDLDTVLPRLNERCPCTETNSSIITLSCTNEVADQVNASELKKLTGSKKIYQGDATGNFKVEDERFPSPLKLELKVGAQVMFTKNDETKRWINGTLGKIVELEGKNIRVELITEQPGEVYDVQPVTWDSYKYEFDAAVDKIVPSVTGKYVQYPLMLAWAVTIHKSQGKTLEKVRVDLGTGAFAPGQVYVALSRCRSLGDITLARPIEITEVKCDQTILRFNKMVFEHQGTEE